MEELVLLLIGAIEEEEDRALAERIYRENVGLVTRMCQKYLGQKWNGEVEDAVCDVVELVCRYIHRLRGRDELGVRKALMIYSKSVCLKKLRRAGLVRFVGLEEEEYEARDRTEEAVLSKLKEEEVSELIGGLKDKYREVLQLKYYLGHKDEEIGRILGISHENVRVRLSRAREQLERRLQAEEARGRKKL